MKPINRFLLPALALLLHLTMSSRAQETKKITIVTSFLPIQSHTAAIAGNQAKVSQLLSQETGPHDFQLKPADVKKIADADLFIINGVGIEGWLQELLKKAGSRKPPVIDASKGLPLLGSPQDIQTGIHDPAAGENPHVWLDPVIAQRQVANILRALQKADPANAKTYARNARAYTSQLKQLDADYAVALKSLPNKNLVTFHDAFPYLARRYGLNYVGYISEYPEKDPTPNQLAVLVGKIKAYKVGVLFAEANYAPKLLQRVAAQSGAKVSQLDTLEVGEGNATAYLDRMRTNLAALRAAFAPIP
ncbi:MAG: zinc ABC transporter substrate-binding protein [Verrucomicrobiae bacterium]|jgi:zinc transport system substrate-binding protein|nr:zinc ABC transporter substrate-binding protein [Verrucomicrobiae bacterium]